MGPELAGPRVNLWGRDRYFVIVCGELPYRLEGRNTPR